MESVGVIPFFALTYVFQGLYLLSTSSIFIEGQKSRYYMISFVTLLVNIVLYISLINCIGVFSVSIITLLGFISMFLIGNKLAFDTTKISYRNVTNMSILLFGVIISIINFYTYQILDGIFFLCGKLFFATILIAGVYFYLKSDIKEMLSIPK